MKSLGITGNIGSGKSYVLDFLSKKFIKTYDLDKIAKNIEADISDFEAIYNIIKINVIDLVIVGPEQPLVNGLVDYLSERKIRVFGPDKFASQLEGSKGFMKNLCKKYNIPTAKYGIFNQLKEAEDFIRKIPKIRPIT